MDRGSEESGVGRRVNIDAAIITIDAFTMDLPGIILSRSTSHPASQIPALHSARRAISRDRGFSQSCFGFKAHYPLNRKQNCKQIAAKRDPRNKKNTPI